MEVLMKHPGAEKLKSLLKSVSCGFSTEEEIDPITGKKSIVLYVKKKTGVSWDAFDVGIENAILIAQTDVIVLEDYRR
jgi:hypothetical protein